MYKKFYTAVNVGYKNFYTAVNVGYKFFYTAVYNTSRCLVQNHYCRDSHPDHGCTKRVQPGKLVYRLTWLLIRDILMLVN